MKSLIRIFFFTCLISPLWVSAHKGSDKSISYLTQVDELYDFLSLDKEGLSRSAFDLALMGLENGIEKNVFEKSSIITIIDMSRSANAKRLYVIDLDRKKVLYNTYVAHGRNTGEEYARKFSNEPESLMSSIGFYKTLQPFEGCQGLAMRLDGLEKGYNDKVRERDIVMHGAVYVGQDFIRKYRVQGRSWGCPALPASESKEIIQTIQGGSCLFIYYPEIDYLTNSPMLTGND
jgi:hypothetical protein